jgi:hypothetical protein
MLPQRGAGLRGEGREAEARRKPNVLYKSGKYLFALFYIRTHWIIVYPFKK